jgi:hypothetical protein
MSDINLTIDSNTEVINLTISEPETYEITFSTAALPDPRVSQAASDALGAKAIAEASAAAAAASEVNAALSETNASASASAASASEIASAASAAAALVSETNAALSESNAATSASNASTSETNAAASESAASASASAASTSETNAATSETNAASSESGAAAAVAAAISGSTTTDLTEGSNLYFTDARAKAAAVLNVTTGNETDKAASVASMKTYVANNAGGAGGSLSWEKIGALSPENESQDGIKLEAFDSIDEQELYLTLNVPENYVAGNPIKLKNGAFFISAITNKILFRTVTALIRPSTTVLGTYTNQHTSTNTEVTANATTNTLTAIGELQLSDASGLINGVAVAANDKLRVKLSRKVASETISAAAKAKLMINNFDVTFK